MRAQQQGEQNVHEQEAAQQPRHKQKLATEKTAYNL